MATEGSNVTLRLGVEVTAIEWIGDGSSLSSKLLGSSGSMLVFAPGVTMGLALFKLSMVLHQVGCPRCQGVPVFSPRLSQVFFARTCFLLLTAHKNVSSVCLESISHVARWHSACLRIRARRSWSGAGFLRERSLGVREDIPVYWQLPRSALRIRQRPMGPIVRISDGCRPNCSA